MNVLALSRTGLWFFVSLAPQSLPSSSEPLVPLTAFIQRVSMTVFVGYFSDLFIPFHITKIIY
jgi:hypothetical protein